MSEISTIGIDLGKLVIYVCCMNSSGRVLLRKKLYRSEFLSFMGERRRCLVGMEACAGAHHWGRELNKLGFEVKLMPPQYVKPYVKTNKNDTNDAEACAEAVTRPTMRFVSVKSEFQQELGQLHRVRERLVKSRTALVNELRGFLSEFGVVLAQGRNKLAGKVQEVLFEDKYLLPETCRRTTQRLLDELSKLEDEIAYYEKQIGLIAKSQPSCQQLMTISGVGELSATAVIAAVGNVENFKNGRQFAAFLGLVPRQHSTGGKDRLGGISKRGDGYIRKLLVQGAHSVLRHVDNKTDKRSVWIRSLRDRRGTCRAAVAIANKNARIIWALLAHGGTYRSSGEMKVAA